MHWLRWYHGSVTDPKFIIVARLAKTTPANVIATWACLLETASQASTRGDVTRCNAEVTAVTLGLLQSEIEAIFNAMRAKGLIENGHLAAWASRQPKREDSSRERVRAHRERKARVTQCNAPVTHCNAKDTQAPPLIPKKENPPHPLKKDHPFTPPSTQLAPAKRIRVLEDLTVDDELREWAKVKAPDVNPDEALDEFLDWRQSKDRPFKDYRAALRGWIRKAQGFINERKPKSSWRDI